MNEPSDKKEELAINHVTYLDKDSHALSAGTYNVKVTQTLVDNGSHETFKAGSPDPIEEYQSFTIGTERFSIDAEVIREIYPPHNGINMPNNSLAHVVLNRSTLPWERRAVSGNNTYPWLGLLLFHEGEDAGTSSVIPVSELSNSSEGHFPEMDIASDHAGQGQVNVLDISKSALEKVLPTVEDLSFSAHVRECSHSGIFLGRKAYVISNRLPKPGLNKVFLVSLENRYTASGFDFQGATPDDLIRLVKLHSWQFTAKEESSESLEHLLRKINMKRDGDDTTEEEAGNDQVTGLLKKGYIPVDHELQQGGKMVSWYHGPLSQGLEQTPALPLVRSSDALLGYMKNIGMLDVSYSLAWELGRLMALRNGSFSKEVYQWKRKYARSRHKDRQMAEPKHLRKTSQDREQVSMPPNVSAWLDGLKYLDGVPFHYLIPSERILGENSIRFFQLDKTWVQSLVQGALSIGTIARSHFELDIQLKLREVSLTNTPISGFVMRSDVVSGWPHVEIEGYSNTGQLNRVRKVRYSNQVLLCLFEGELKRVDIYQHAAHSHINVVLDAAKQSNAIDDSHSVRLVSWEKEAQECDYLDFGMAQGISFRKPGFMEVMDEKILSKDPRNT